MKKTAIQSKPKPVFNPKDFEGANISSEQVLEIKESFDLFDYEGTGYIDPKGAPIDFAKFFEILTAGNAKKDSKASLKFVFSLFDDEKSGFISIKNLRKVVKEVGENIDDSELQEMVERADLDNDGLISQQQFYGVMTRKGRKA